jgi:hypothetical protein
VGTRASVNSKVACGRSSHCRHRCARLTYSFARRIGITGHGQCLGPRNRSAKVRRSHKNSRSDDPTRTTRPSFVSFHKLIVGDFRIIGSRTSSAPAAKDIRNLVTKHGIKARTNIFHSLSEDQKIVDFARSEGMQEMPVVVIDEDTILKE